MQVLGSYGNLDNWALGTCGHLDNWALHVGYMQALGEVGTYLDDWY